MLGRILPLILVGLWSFPVLATAGLTLLQREPFQGVGTLNAATPGNLGTVVSGSFPKRPVGPSLPSDASAAARGWSADLSGQSTVYFQPALGTNFPAAGKGFVIDRWLYQESPVVNEIFSQIQLGARLAGYLTIHAGVLQVGYFGTPGSSYGGDNGTLTGPLSQTLPLRTWVQIREVAFPTSGTNNPYHIATLLRVAGGTWTTLADQVNGQFYGSTVATANNTRFGFFDGGGGAYPFRARFGMFSVYTIDSWADATALDPTVVDPPAGPFQWYVNPATGNDNNDGTTPQTAWASAAKINAESAALGMFGRAGHGQGDALTLDLSAADLPAGGYTSLANNTAGSTWTQLGTHKIQCAENVSGAGWTQTSGTTVVWQKPLSGNGSATANAYTVAFCNDAPMAHVLGAQLSDAQAGLVSTANSFFADGTTLYLHAPNGTNPNTDGNVYERTYFRGGSGDPGVLLNAPDWTLNNFRVEKTVVARNTDNDNASSYCYQTAGTSGGVCFLNNCNGRYGSKHVLGFTDSSLTRTYNVVGGTYEQCSAYTTYFGATSVLVDYTQVKGNGTSVSNYAHVEVPANVAIVGSTVGAAYANQPVWISHSTNDGTNPFAAINFTNCDFSGGGDLLGYPGIVALHFTGGKLWSASCGGGVSTFTGVTLFDGIPVPTTAGATVNVSNCLGAFVTGGQFHADGATAAGTLDVVGSTWDTRNISNPGALINRGGALSLEWENNLVLGATCPVLGGAISTDTLTFDHNAYPSAGSVVASGYNDGTTTANRTFTQWQALGQDAASLATSDLALDANDFPAVTSPLTDAGADLGATTDFTGRFFTERRTIGALEPLSVFARWQSANFTAAELDQPTISAAAADPDGDGSSNLLEYAMGTDPKYGNPAVTSLGVESVSGQSYLTLTYPQLEYAADLTYTPQVSADLINWQGGTAALVQVSRVDNGDGTATVVVRDAQPLSTLSQHFLRLQVSAPGLR